MGTRKHSDYIQIPLALSHESEVELAQARSNSERELNVEIWNDPNGPGSKAYFRPPGRPDLTYKEVGELERQHRERWDALTKIAKTPKSHVSVQIHAWAWDIAPLSDKLDDLTRRMLRNYGLYLCRYIVRLVEAKDEKIGWVVLELANAGTIIYQLWPQERFVTNATATAKGVLSGKIGLTPALEIISVSAEADTEVVWKTEWKWVSAIIKAWGVADFRAGWELTRDSTAPFAGDREFYLLLQLPKGELPSRALATVRAEINPRGLFTTYIYDSKEHGPVEIGYQVA